MILGETFGESLSDTIAMGISRSLRNAPGFVIAAVLTLGLGIGANVACFSVIRAVLLKPLGYRNPEQLVLISGGATPVHFAEIQTSTRNFSAVGAYAMEEDLAFTGRGTPEVLKTNRVSTNFLQILGVSPLLGAGFTTSDNTALISSNLWQHRFDGDFHVLGQTIDLGGTSYTISGVLPPNFAFPSTAVDVWLARPEESPQFPPQSRALSPFLTVFGRLQPGVGLDQATAEMKVLQASYAKAHPAMLDAKPKAPVAAATLQQAVVSNVRLELWLLFGAIWLVLLIACANIASLLLARAAARSKEFAVRSALGASRPRLIKQLLSESLLLAALGGVAGAFLAFFSMSILRQMAGMDLPRASEIQFDGAVLAFAILLSLVVALLFGLAPAISASRVDLMTILRTGQGTSPTFSPRNALVIGQIALSIVLLISATLLIESIAHLRSEELGFDSQHLLTARVTLPQNAKPERFFADLLPKIIASSDAEHASVSFTLPMTNYPGTPVQMANQPPLPLNQRSLAAIFIVTPDYFRTLRIPLKRGRVFTERDREGTQRVAVIDENLARHFWPDYPAGPNPVGRRLLVGGVNKAPAEIVGIVANAHQDMANSGWNRGVYVSFAQSPTPSAMVAVRVKGNPMQFAATLRGIVQSVNPAQPVSNVEPMQDLVDAQLGTHRVLMLVLVFFAIIAFALALVGVYGVVSYSVARRTQEMGIRRALGARESNILQMVIGQTLRLTLGGIVIGAAFAMAVTRFLGSYLFKISATDPVTFAAVAALFIVATVAAAFVPAFRAATIDPVRALRYE